MESWEWVLAIVGTIVGAVIGGFTGVLTFWALAGALWYLDRNKSTL